MYLSIWPSPSIRQDMQSSQPLCGAYSQAHRTGIILYRFILNEKEHVTFTAICQASTIARATYDTPLKIELPPTLKQLEVPAVTQPDSPVSLNVARAVSQSPADRVHPGSFPQVPHS